MPERNALRQSFSIALHLARDQQHNFLKLQDFLSISGGELGLDVKITKVCLYFCR